MQETGTKKYEMKTFSIEKSRIKWHNNNFSEESVALKKFPKKVWKQQNKKKIKKKILTKAKIK